MTPCDEGLNDGADLFNGPPVQDSTRMYYQKLRSHLREINNFNKEKIYFMRICIKLIGLNINTIFKYTAFLFTKFYEVFFEF